MERGTLDPIQSRLLAALNIRNIFEGVQDNRLQLMWRYGAFQNLGIGATGGAP